MKFTFIFTLLIFIASTSLFAQQPPGVPDAPPGPSSWEEIVKNSLKIANETIDRALTEENLARIAEEVKLSEEERQELRKLSEEVRVKIKDIDHQKLREEIERSMALAQKELAKVDLSREMDLVRKEMERVERELSSCSRDERSRAKE